MIEAKETFISGFGVHGEEDERDEVSHEGASCIR